MITNSSIKKDSKVNRAKRRLEKAITNLDTFLQDNSFVPYSESLNTAEPKKEAEKLSEKILILSENNKIASSRIDNAIRRLKLVIGE